MPQCTEPNLSGKAWLFSVDLRNRIEPVPYPEASFRGGLSSHLLTQVQNTTDNRPGCATMQSAQYLRSQAELYLELAQQLSNRQDAERLRLAAADYFRRAIDAERQSEAREPSSPSEL
jgi:hypothetical protein